MPDHTETGAGSGAVVRMSPNKTSTSSHVTDVITHTTHITGDDVSK